MKWGAWGEGRFLSFLLTVRGALVVCFALDGIFLDDVARVGKPVFRLAPHTRPFLASEFY